MPDSATAASPGKGWGQRVPCRPGSRMPVWFSLWSFHPSVKLEELSRDGLGESEEKEKEEPAWGFRRPFVREALWLWVQHASRTVVPACSVWGVEITSRFET